MKKLAVLALCGVLAGCGAIYITPDVTEETTEAGLKVRVVPLTAETAIAANRSAYTPRSLPPEFDRAMGLTRPSAGAAATPEAVFDPVARAATAELRPPPPAPLRPYTIGTGDVLLFASPSASSTVEQLSGLLAAQNARQGYTVQDDGAVAIPNVGRVEVAGLTLEEAEGALFERLVEAGIEPAFSIEIAEFGSRKVSVGGGVARPSVIPLGLNPVTLDEAIALAGGLSAPSADYAVIRIYRDGTLYQIPATAFLGRADLRGIRLADGDSVFVDTTYDLARAQAYFEQQIALANLERSARSNALSELRAEIDLRTAERSDRRAAFQRRIELDAVARDYVYLAGEVVRQTRVPLPFEGRATLADILYAEGGFRTQDGNPGQIYVLRGSPDPAEISGLTAYNLDAENAANLLLATRFEMRPNDIVFIAEQPVTRWNRAISLVIPNIVTAAATN